MIGYAEIAGSGVNAILKAVKAHHLERPQVINTIDYFTLVIGFNSLASVTIQKEDLKSSEAKVYEVLANSPKLSRKEIELRTSLSRQSTLNSLNELIKKDLVLKKGEGKNTIYTINQSLF